VPGRLDNRFTPPHRSETQQPSPWKRGHASWPRLARLHAIADELASNNDVVIERGDLRFVAHVPDQVHLKVEFEIEDDGTELEIELTW
jgi:amphi-Trp domain-containing protein